MTRWSQFDQWMRQYNWSGLLARLARVYPDSNGRVCVAGWLEDRVGAPFTRAEIADRYGGGIFEVQLFSGRPSRLLNRHLLVLRGRAK